MAKMPKRDLCYYLGLLFLLLSCGSIFWCIAKENFALTEFLVFLVFFSWGFGLLWKSDMDLRFAFTEGELESLRTQLKELSAESALELTAIDGDPEDGLPGDGEPEDGEPESEEPVGEAPANEEPRETPQPDIKDDSQGNAGVAG